MANSLRGNSEKSGDFNFRFTGGSQKIAFEKQISNAEWYSELDQSDLMKIRFPLTKKQSLDLKITDLPHTLNFEWQNRDVFSGSLVDMSFVSQSVIELSFRDKLYSLTRKVDSSHFKSESLMNVLKNLSSKVSLETKFFGDFNEVLPSIFLGSQNLYQNIKFLSDKFGFFFYFHAPSGLLHFLRLGASSSVTKIDSNKYVTDFQQKIRSDLSWDSVETRVFDDRDLSTQTKKYISQSLYGALDSVSSHGAFRGKQKWPFAKGSYETHAQNSTEYEDGDRRIQYPLAKQAIFQEVFTLSTYHAMSLPGEHVEVSKSLNPDLLDGKYLVHSCQAEFSSSRPKMNMSLIRP